MSHFIGENTDLALLESFKGLQGININQAFTNQRVNQA
jgi:hypothetical protein